MAVAITDGYDTTRVGAQDAEIRAATQAKAALVLDAFARDLHPGAEVEGSPAEAAALEWLGEMLAILGLKGADVTNRCRSCGQPIPDRVMKDVGAPTGRPRRYCGTSCAASHAATAKAAARQIREGDTR